MLPAHSNARVPISTTLAGISMLVSPQLLANALSAIRTTVFGITILFRPFFLANAPFPMLVTV